MSVEQQTQHKSWTEVSNSRHDKLREALKTAKSLKDIDSDEYEEVEVERAGVSAVSVSVKLTEGEVENAPQEILMVLYDLGVTAEDEIHAQVTLDTFYEEPHNFWFSLKPEEVTSQKLGVGLSKNGNNFIINPTSRAFDGVYKMVNTYVGRAASLHELYVDEMGNKANPHLADILSSGINWFKYLLDARRKHIEVETAASSHKPTQGI